MTPVDGSSLNIIAEERRKVVNRRNSRTTIAVLAFEIFNEVTVADLYFQVITIVC